MLAIYIGIKVWAIHLYENNKLEKERQCGNSMLCTVWEILQFALPAHRLKTSDPIFNLY